MAEEEPGTEAANETDEAAPPAGSAQADTDAADDTSADADDKADESDEEPGAQEDATPSSSSDSGEVLVEGGLDVEAERGRLDDVEQQIEDGRRALADLEEDVEPESDGPPVAAGEGAANAPPG